MEDCRAAAVLGQVEVSSVIAPIRDHVKGVNVVTAIPIEQIKAEVIVLIAKLSLEHAEVVLEVSTGIIGAIALTRRILLSVHLNVYLLEVVMDKVEWIVTDAVHAVPQDLEDVDHAGHSGAHEDGTTNVLGVCGQIEGARVVV